jgi:hypothetical protein
MWQNFLRNAISWPGSLYRVKLPILAEPFRRGGGGGGRKTKKKKKKKNKKKKRVKKF